MPPDAPRLTRRRLLALLAAGAAGPALAEGPATSPRPPRRPGLVAATPKSAAPGEELGALIEAAKLGGIVGLAVRDAVTGEVLEAVEGGTALPPASTLKTLTALYALDRLGPGHRWHTQVIATGPVSGGTVQGDLILAGGGDPTLSTDMLGDLAAEVARRGVRKVTGDFRVWDGALPAIDLIDGDQPDYVGYNPAIAGLNLNFNRVYFEWRKAGGDWAFSMDARGERFVPAVRMADVTAVDRDLPVFSYKRGKDRDRWTVSARALGKGGGRWLPVRHPGIYAADVFRTLARAQGITLPEARAASAAPRGTVIAEAPSDALPEVLRDMLKFSTNITAEVVGLSASGARSLRMSGESMSDWARTRLGAEGRFVDHSGLGGASRIAPAAMAAALAAGRDGLLPTLLKDHGMRDAKGKEIEGHPVRVLAKTGTLNFVSGLAGYILPPGGRTLTFAIFCADTARRDALSMAEREEPKGGSAWTKRARRLQAQLVGRWAGLFA
jgi:D-alanyl-D-alanine carboxypeptidase/D-alanyl-D-alanine-endopeptidase (penicillin-binding protein 4)